MIVLDTHALVWWASDPRRIPRKARNLIEAAVTSSEPMAVSSISIWEIAMLVDRGRLQLTIDAGTWISSLEALPQLTFVPVDNRIAIRAVHLEGFPHHDPADRIIVATALGLNATLVTADRRLRAYRSVPTAWN